MSVTQMLLEEELSIDEKPWVEIELPPTDLPYDDGHKLESPWHVGNAMLIKASYIAVRGGGIMDDYYIGVNMFLYYSMEQVRNRHYRGPDVFIVKDVDGTRDRLSWIVWAEQGRYPNVIFELLSPSTERNDLGPKKQLYEQTFHTEEYFCVAPNVERLLGWRLHEGTYEPISPNEQGWLWSKQLEVWLGPWEGTFLADTYTWLRFYTADGELVRLPDEMADERVQAAEARATEAEQRAQRLAALLREQGIDPESLS